MIRYFVSLTLLLQKRTRADVFARLKQSDKGVPLAPYRCRPAGDLRRELRSSRTLPGGCGHSPGDRGQRCGSDYPCGGRVNSGPAYRRDLVKPPAIRDNRTAMPSTGATEGMTC